jgi:GNAT superfamily N-acetyltransferase
VSQFARYEADRPAATSSPWTEHLRVRPAAVRDSGALAEILIQREGGGDVVAHRNRFNDLVDRAGKLLLVAELAVGVVAYGYADHHGGSEGCPPGWYLVGLVVSPPFRRHGIGRLLTTRRLDWIAERASEAFYFANERNRATIDLHTELGFKELTRDFAFPGVAFRGGSGVLFRADLDATP